LLFLCNRVAYAQSFHFEIDWTKYIQSLRDNPGSSEGIYHCHCFVDKDFASTYLSVGEIEWELLVDSSEIRRFSGLPSFSGIQSAIYSANEMKVVSCMLVPFKLEGNQFFRMKSFKMHASASSNPKSTETVSVQAVSSVLAKGKWIKVAIKGQGIFKITYDKLKEWGITAPDKLGLYGNGGAELPKMNQDLYPDDLVLNPVLHANDASGKACVFFYSPGTSSLSYDVSGKVFKHTINSFSDSAYYYLSSDAGVSPGIISQPALSGTPDAERTSYDEYGFIEREANSPMHSGRKLYGDIFKPLTKNTYKIEFANVISEQPASLTIAGAGRSSTYTNFEIYVNGVYKDQIPFGPVDVTSNYTMFASENEKTWSIAANNKTEVSINYLTESAGGDAWLDFISVSAKAHLSFNGSVMHFRNGDDHVRNLVQYTVQNVPSSAFIWNVSDPLHPVQVFQASQQAQGTVSFKVSGGKVTEYVIFNILGSQIPEPTFIEDVENQDIKGSPVPDLIIVTHPEFLSSANLLAKHRRENDGFSVLVVTTQQVYNEFSSGIADVAAIRNMARYFYRLNPSNSNRFRYLLLMGDGHYNNRSAQALIPTYQSENSLHKLWSYVTDDFFGLLGDNEGESSGYLDIGVGRLTCNTKDKAAVMVSKIINYDSSESRGNWRNRICFIADDEDSNIHMTDTEKLIDTVKTNNPGFFIDKIYFDAYKQVRSSDGDKYPEVAEEINRRVKEGVLILNYVGHANNSSLAHEDVLLTSHINSWNNSQSLPVFVTATCEFSQFDEDQESAGEMILSNPNGGGVALFSTTRVVYSNENYNLSNNFYGSIFELDSDGEKLRLGEVMRRAKNKTLYDTNKLSFVLLADPSMRLAFPRYNVVSTSINGVPVNEGLVTVGALEKVTIEGMVCDRDNNLMPSFNGEVTAMLYDKELSIKTLANDGGKPFTFSMQNNLIYKGKASVEQGRFKFSFVVPKDISYQIGAGRIFYYAVNESEDANGSSNAFNIGGTGANPIIENNPPEIQLFMNDEQFQPYGKVASSALLLVKLFDETGINTVGAGIGHDLIGVLDSNYTNQFVLNDYYSAKANSYQEGTILYPLNNLEPGEHTILVKVWDVQNNSTEKEIHFIVEDGFKVFSVNNYPNPVEDVTYFAINHNLPGETFKAKVDIFSLDGRKVYAWEENVTSSGGVVSRLKWDSNRLSMPLKMNQILVYRVMLESPKGEQAGGAGKLYLKKRLQ